MIFSDDANPKDPREKPVPPRPKGQRPEPESTGGSTFGGFGGFGGGGKLKDIGITFNITSYTFQKSCVLANYIYRYIYSRKWISNVIRHWSIPIWFLCN